MKPFKIRNINIDPPLILSPMAGVTDYTFRRLIKRRGGVGLVVSEFISVEGLTRHNPKSKRQMRFDEEERPYAVQIFGGQAERVVNITVSGNGDITSLEYGMKKWRETGVDGVLIGRGAMQNPWIFRQFADVLAGREPYQPDLKEKKDVLLEFFSMCREEMPEIPALGKMKQLAGQFTKGLVGGAQFRQTLYHSHSADEILENISIYFQTLERRDTFGDGVVEEDRDLEFTSCEAPEQYAQDSARVRAEHP